MKRNKKSKLIAAIAAGAMLLSSLTASAQLALTADQIMDSTKINQEWMLHGFSMDSKNWAWDQTGANYGVYHEHYLWENNLIGLDNQQQPVAWNADDSMNIYPIGTPDTAYSSINTPEAFLAQPYASYRGTDVKIWNGYMFVVLEQTNWMPAPEGQTASFAEQFGATFESVIQVYDIANGKKEHVATWEFDDLGIGGTEQGISYGIRQIEVTDDNIFMLLDMGGEKWRFKKENWGGWPGPFVTDGCGLAIFDNNISRADGTVDLPTRSAVQTAGDANSDMARYGVDTQWELFAAGNQDNSGLLAARGDYLIYFPDTADVARLDTLKQDDYYAKDTGVYVVKWNDSARAPGQKIEFVGYNIENWMGLPKFPAEYVGVEHWGSVKYPQLTGVQLDGDLAHMLITYCAPEGTGYHQFDALYTVDISDPTAPVVTQSTTIKSPAPGEGVLKYRTMAVDEKYLYISQRQYENLGDTVHPYMYIVDKSNLEVVNTFALRDYINNDTTRGAETIAVVGNYLVITADFWTVFMELSADRTEILDSCGAKYITGVSAINGGIHAPLIHGNRIFYPMIHGGGDAGSFRYATRIEVIDFSQALPMGLFVNDIINNGDDTYTISGTLRGVEVLPNLYDVPVITVNDADGEWVSEVFYGDLETEIDVETDISAWSFTTDADMPANLTFVLNDTWGDMIEDAAGNPKVYENVNLGLIGVDPVFTMKGTAPEAIAAGDYSVTISASNMTARDVENAVVVVAVYDADGKLVAVTTGNPETILSGEAKELAPVTATVPQAASYAGYTAKAMLLDSVEGLAPVCANLAF